MTKKTTGIGWVMIMAMAFASATAIAAEPGDGIKLGASAVLHPYLDVSIINDDNVTVSPDNEADDTSIMGKIGARVGNRTDEVKFSADVWALSERYTDLDDEDHEDFGDRLGLTLGRTQEVQFKLKQAYTDTESLDYGTGEIQARELLSGEALVVVPLSDKLAAALGGRGQSTAYDSPRYFDWDQSAGVVQLGHKISDKTAIVATGIGGVQSSDALDEDTDFYQTRIGFRNKQTAKLSGEAGIGYQNYATGNEDIDGVHFYVGAQWRLSEKVSLRISGQNSVEPGSLNTEANNSKEVTQAALAARWAMTDEVSTTLKSRFRRNDFNAPVDGVAKEDDTVDVSLRVDYAPPAKFIKLYAEATNRDKDSTIDSNDFSQVMAKAGIQLQY